MAKAPKLYFYDWAYVKDPQATEVNSGARFENLVASHLLKHVQYLNDTQGRKLELRYLRTTSGTEIDFVLVDESGQASQFIEAKLSDEKPSYALREMAKSHPQANAVQIVLNAKHSYRSENVEIYKASDCLASLAA